jgi:hypothetical protein
VPEREHSVGTRIDFNQMFPIGDMTMKITDGKAWARRCVGFDTADLEDAKALR